jgi:MFS family permease
LRWRLSLLMFLNYAVPGAVVPFYSLHLQHLGIDPVTIGWCCATQGLAAVLTPLLAAQAADRWVAAERCLTALTLISTIACLSLFGATSVVAILTLSMVFWLAVAPCLTLGVVVSMAHLQHPELHYGPVRMFGTIGWVATGWLLGGWFAVGQLLHVRETPADVFILGGAIGLVLVGYTLFLPHTPPERRSGAAPLAALILMRNRDFAVFMIGVLIVSITSSFTTQLTPLLLEQRGVPDAWIGPVLTLAQSTEILGLGFLPFLLRRFGERGTMLLGLCSWSLALWILMADGPVTLLAGSQILNGLCMAGYLVAGAVFINRRAPDDIRASAQALLTVTSGLGILFGHVAVGWIRHELHGDLSATFAVAAGLAAALLAGFAVGFRGDDHCPRETVPRRDEAIGTPSSSGRPATTTSRSYR